MRLARVLRIAAAGPLPKFAAQAPKLDYYSQFQPSPLSIQQYLDFGRTGDQKQSYLFLRKELLVRLANIMKEINLLPPELLVMPSARLVQEWYHQSFEDLLSYENVSGETETLSQFLTSMSGVLKRHGSVVETMAEGLLELKERHGVDVATERGLQYFLDRLYINRVSIRMLMNQHLLLFGDAVPESPRLVGAIDPACDVVATIQDAYDNARFLCDRFYLTSPGLKLEVKSRPDEKGIAMVYTPSHLYHICFELIKNALRAVVEHHGVDEDLPDIKIFVVKGKEDVSIKICDRGGGVPRSVVDLLFNYMYSTAPPPARDEPSAPLAGYGYGLPLARLYARYFQGEVFLVSMDGYGTDAVIQLKALPMEASEQLPIYSTSSRYGLPLARLYARYFQGEVFLVSMDGYGTDAVIQLKALPMEASEQLPIYSTSSRYGLPLARLYARYFQGEVFLVSMDGYGTDAVIQLKALPMEASEQLPIYSTSSRYGLPLARLYARYFQGEVFLVSMDGYGTDAVIQLKALPMEASEQLPIYSTSSRYGLPLARLYARYFQGEVFLVSMDGYGTDAVIQLKALPMEASEQLPIYSTSSRYGLPLARLYARYFQGEVFLVSMDGYGTDAVIQLKALPMEASEQLPIYSTSSRYGLPLARLYARYFQGEVFLVSMDGYGTDAVIQLKALPMEASEQLPIYSTSSRYGLPLARLYARYFQGEVFLVSMDGYGTDAVIQLKALPMEASEQLPIYSTSSRYGLPLARLYARYFQGEVFLVSMDGYGTDAVIQLKALPMEASEQLPIYSTSSRYGLPLARLYARYFQGEVFLVSMDGYGTDAVIQLKALPMEASEQLPIYSTSSRYGLPLARLYARYFQGEVFLVSMDGYGTDAVIQLKALPMEASEQLPIYSTSSRRQLTMATQAMDWSQPVSNSGLRAFSTASLARRNA